MNRMRTVLSIGLVVFASTVARAQATEASIGKQISGLRALPDAQRPAATTKIAMDIRTLPAGLPKLKLADSLTHLSTEGDPGREPNRYRPLSFAPPATWQDDGGISFEDADLAQPCLSEPDAAKFGDNWQCGADTVCTPLATTDKTRIALAQCLPPPDSQMYSGLPCLQGEVASSADQPFNDQFPLTQFAAFAPKASAADYTCRPPRIGVPGGLAYRKCNDKDRTFASFKPGAEFPPEICGLTGGKAFEIVAIEDAEIVAVDSE